MKNFEYGKRFTYEGKEYYIIGEDAGRNEIECQTVPLDSKFYWFKIVGENKVKLIN